MIYSKKATDGYTKVGAGAVQLQCKRLGTTLAVIHSDVAPAATDAPDFTIDGDSQVHATLGVKDCYVKVMSVEAVEFGATEI